APCSHYAGKYGRIRYLSLVEFCPRAASTFQWREPRPRSELLVRCMVPIRGEVASETTSSRPVGLRPAISFGYSPPSATDQFLLRSLNNPSRGDVVIATWQSLRSH